MTSFHSPPSVPWDPDAGSCSVDGCGEPVATFQRLGRTARRDVCAGHYRERCRSVWESRRAGGPRAVRLTEAERDALLDLVGEPEDHYGDPGHPLRTVKAKLLG